MEKMKEVSFEELEDVTGGMEGSGWAQCGQCYRMTPTTSLERYNGICRSCNSENNKNNS